MSREDRQAAEFLARQVRDLMDMGSPRNTPFDSWLADYFMRFLAERQQALTVETLAPLLATYECDEPHAGEAKPYYPQNTWADIQRDLEHPHDGDCVKQPQPCVRCHAEGWVHKAEWLIAALGGKGSA